MGTNAPETLQQDYISYWHSKEGQALLYRTQSILESFAFDSAPASLKLKKLFPDTPNDHLKDALEITISRNKTKSLGAWAKRGLFTKQSIEQASHPLIAAHHAKRFENADHVLEIGTGVGLDTAALARKAQKVTSIEHDPKIAAYALHNLRLQGISNVVILTGKAETIIPSLCTQTFDGLWADPSRRDPQGKRVWSAEDYRPKLSFVLTIPCAGVRGIKISPGLNLEVQKDFVREWIAFDEDCREQVLWSNTDVVDGTTYNASCARTWIPRDLLLTAESQIFNASFVGATLVEPHGAVIRSGRLQDFFLEHALAFLDPRIAYGIRSDLPPASVWYRRFKVLDALPYGLKKLKAKLKQLGWDSRTEIKKRGFPDDPDTLRGKLNLPKPQTDNDSFGVIFLTKIGNDHHIILAKRID